MQASIPNWPTAIVEIAKYFIPAAITATASIWLSRHQYKSKLAELDTQSKLKAREILFGSYQKRIERVNDQVKEMAQAIEKIIPELKRAEETHGTEEALKAFVILVSMTFDVWRDDFIELETEMARYHIAEKWKNQISYLKVFFSQKPSEFNTANIMPIYLGFMRSAGLISLFNNDLLTERCEELFSDYLPDRKLKKL
jgi:hypothetical protein